MAMLFTSDLHLGHNNVLPSRQQFQDINEHDDTLIFKWNNKVKKNDDVYILGDLSFRSPHHISYYLSRMKGRKQKIRKKKHCEMMARESAWRKFENAWDELEEAVHKAVV